MKSLAVILGAFLLVVAAAGPVAADEGEPQANEEYGFNILAKFIRNLGEREDGTKAWEFDMKTRDNTESVEQIKDRRRSQGVASGGL